MAKDLIGLAARETFKLALFIGIACPGVIDENGVIENGGQNLPDDCECPEFNLAREMTGRLPRPGGHEAVVVMHNDALVQGLKELLKMANMKRRPDDRHHPR